MTLCLVLTMLCFVSCASMNPFEKRLEESYNVEIIDKEYLELLGDIDSDDYRIKKVLLATISEDGVKEAVYVVSCGNPFSAIKLVYDLRGELDGYSVVKLRFNYVIVGTEGAVADALGK